MQQKYCGKTTFFRFPKEHERWLQWIRACERLDLEAMGAEYGHRNYRLCHLHFEEKWYEISKSRAHLQLDAVPIFFGRNNACITTSANEKMDEELPEEENLYILQQEETNSDLQSKSFSPITEQMQKCDKDVHIIAKPSTSSSTIRREESPRKKKLQQRIVRLQGRVKTLDERNRRLQKKVKILTVRKKKSEKEKLKDHEILRQLGFPMRLAAIIKGEENLLCVWLVILPTRVINLFTYFLSAF
ncbi:uncharacterized protein [Temnothorax longispinosus]|uniref:uncharacterized protein isoform X2 n=2 Tax=Temnothorax longispinosus TaxID=300112 RepID=UPI003A98F27D